MFSIVGAEPNGLVLQIMGSANETHGLALRSHEDRVCDCVRTLGYYSTQKRAVANPGGAKDDVFSVRQIIGKENAI